MIEKPPSVDLATPDDASSIYGLLVQMHLGSNFARLFPYDAQMVYDIIAIGIEGRGGIIGVIKDSDKRLVATVGLSVERWWWTKDTAFLRMLWLFVHPRERKNPQHAKDLFQFAAYCRQFMAAELCKKGETRPFLLELGFQRLDRIAARERMWRRYGRKIGASFLSGL